MKRFLIIFLFVISLFGQGRFYPDGNDLKPKDPNWGIDVDHIKIKNVDLIPSIATEIDSIAERVDTLRNVKKVYLVNGTDTTEIYDNGDTVYVSPSGGRPIKLGNVTVDDISVQNIYVLQGGSSYLVEGQLGSDATIILDPSMTRNEIQDSINMIPRNLGGHSLTFQFSDGTYNLDHTLYFLNFYGGPIYVKGNVGESGLHTNQAVILNFTNVGDFTGIYVRGITSSIEFSNLRINTPSISRGIQAVESNISVQFCYFVGQSGVGSALYFVYSNGRYISQNYINGYQDGMFVSSLSNVYSSTNDDINNTPTRYGLFVRGGSTLGKFSTQPSGATANEFTEAGGEIR